MMTFALVDVFGDTINLSDPASPIKVRPSPGLFAATAVTTGRIDPGRRPVRTASTYRVPFLLSADTPELLHDVLRDLARSVNSTIGDVRFIVTRTDGTSRELVATYHSGLDDADIENCRTRTTVVDLRFWVNDPFWHGTTLVDPVSTLPVTNDGNGRWSASFQLDNPGDEWAWPNWRIVLQNTGNVATIANGTTGKAFSIERTAGIATGDFRIATSARTIRTADGVNVYQTLSPDAALRTLFPLRPGINALMVDVEATIEPILEVTWRPRYSLA